MCPTFAKGRLVSIHVYGHPVADKKRRAERKKKNTPENEPQLATSVFNRSGSVSAARFVMIVAANHAKRKRHLNSISFTILNHQHPSYPQIVDISSIAIYFLQFNRSFHPESPLENHDYFYFFPILFHQVFRSKK